MRSSFLDLRFSSKHVYDDLVYVILIQFDEASCTGIKPIDLCSAEANSQIICKIVRIDYIWIWADYGYMSVRNRCL